MSRGEEILIRIKAEAQQAVETLKRLDAQADALKKGFSGVGDVIGKGFKVAAATVAALGTASVAVGAKMLSGAGQVERYAAVLETVTGSAETARQKLAWLRDFAAKTPFELPGLMEAATKLEAYGFSAEKYLSVLGDTSAALGKDVMAAVEALADATTGEFERLKEFGIKASAEGAKVAFEYVDKSGKQQRVVVDKTNREMIASTLTAIWNERYEGAMERMSTTWEGMWSNMKDAMTKALADAGKDLLPIFKPALEQVTAFLEGEQFRGILQTIGTSFAELAPVIMRVFEAASPLVEVFGQLVEALTPVFVDLIGRLADVLSRAAEALVNSGVVDSIARIVQAVGSEFVDLLDRLLQIAIPLLDIALKAITPLTEIADKLGLIQGFVYALIAAEVASGISSLVQSTMTLASSLMSLGTAAAVGTAATGAAVTGGLAALTAPITASASSIGAAIGGGIVAGITGYAIGNKIAECLKSLTGLKQAEQELMEAEAREAQSQKQLNQILAERAEKMRTIVENNRAAVMSTQEYNDRLALMTKYFHNQQLASDFAVASLVDVRAALDALTAQQIVWNQSAADLVGKNDEAAAKLREMANAAAQARLELAAVSGVLKEEALAALAQMAPLPGQVADALRSSNPQVVAAGQEAINAYISGLVQVAGLPPAQAAQISRAVAQALGSADPEIRRKGYEQIAALVRGLVQSKGLPQQAAWEIARSVGQALGLSDREIAEIANKYGIALEEIRKQLAARIPNVKAEAEGFASTMRRLLKLEGSPGVDEWAPQLYRQALRGIEAEFRLANFPAATEHAIAAPAAVMASGGFTYNIHFHIPGFFGTKHELDALARRLITEHIPRARYGTVGA
ncbi:MAG: tape measure protein [Actinomycetota bacterium]|nr:tape measure protein [Actinomycetota bacterium]